MESFTNVVSDDTRKNGRENSTIAKANVIVNSKQIAFEHMPFFTVDETLQNVEWEHTKGSRIHLQAELTKGDNLQIVHAFILFIFITKVEKLCH